MIFRRFSRTEPRHRPGSIGLGAIGLRSSVLGSTLALLLPFGAELLINPGALAQTAPAQVPAPQTPASPAAPVTSPADALKARDQELDAARARQRDLAENQAKLRVEIDALSTDRRKFNEQLIDTASRIRDVEADIDATEARLVPLDQKEQLFKKSLDDRRAVIVEILAALQRIGRQPPPVLIVRPEDALQAVRTAIALGAVLPEMREQADALAGDLSELVGVRQQIVDERDRRAENLKQLARDQLRMSLLIDERQKKQALAEQSLDAQRQQAADLGRQVDSIKDLIAKLEASLDPATRAAHAAARAIANDATQPELAALGDPGRLAPAAAFADLRGRLRLPVNGRIVNSAGPTAPAARKRASRRLPARRADYGAMRLLGCLRRRVSQLWATLDPECRGRVSCAPSGDGTDFR